MDIVLLQELFVVAQMRTYVHTFDNCTWEQREAKQRGQSLETIVSNAFHQGRLKTLENRMKCEESKGLSFISWHYLG